MRPPLTGDQQAAAATRAPLAFIEAAPGSGKTTVAAERFGVLRYESGTGTRRVLGLSFARSARHELAARIRARWGARCLAWPHTVLTLDALHCELVTHLLRTDAIQWPAGRTELTVLDTWRGQPGSRYLLRDNDFHRVVTLAGTRVTSAGRRITRPVYGIGQRAAFERHLAAGVCTHDEIRQVLRHALGSRALYPLIEGYLRATVRALVVDEIFDANDLDIAVVRTVAVAGADVTVIGDPWQALYGFRDARPDLVRTLVTDHGFATLPVRDSFRFQTPQMRALAHTLRAGEPAAVAAGEAAEADVVLAKQWDHLWDAAPCVLPLSFGKIDNHTDAAIVLLLDRLVTAHFGHGAIFAPEAMTLLGLDPDVMRLDGPAALGPVLATLADDTDAAAAAAIAKLRSALRQLGSPKELRRLAAAGEAEQHARLRGLARRMSHPQLVPGMTVHQAKGREWPVVAVCLSPPDRDRLAAGLRADREDDRILYVALTRARDAVLAV